MIPKKLKKASATNNPVARTPSLVARERALLVHMRLPRAPEQEDLDELRLLTASAGAQVCRVIQGTRSRPDPAMYIGKGKAQEVRQAVLDDQIDLVVVNHNLSPAQERNLEKIIGCRVLDRTGLILDIFAQRARSHEGKLQVELAQLEHLSTRLVRGWTHLERQKGGIGLRGPGETQLETDRRLVAERIKNLNRRLQKVRTQRGQRRKARKKIPIPTVSLVGYTNAGKSSLFNRLTGAAAYAADRLFATLDPTMRRLVLPDRSELILADTVGFIRHLPHDLIAAFRSTLEEVSEAELLLHVVDAGNPERLEYMEQVNQVLAEIDAQHIPQILLFNKIDLSGAAPHCERDVSGKIRKIWLSAHTGAGLDLLLQALAQHFHHERSCQRLKIPQTAGRLRARIYDRLEVVRERSTEDGFCLLDVKLDEEDLTWLQHQEGFHAQWLMLDPDAAVLAQTRVRP